MSKRRMAMERLLTTRTGEDAPPTPVRVGAVKTMGLALLDMEDGKRAGDRSEEHTSELQSQSTISYAVFCLKKKRNNPRVFCRTL